MNLPEKYARIQAKYSEDNLFNEALNDVAEIRRKAAHDMVRVAYRRAIRDKIANGELDSLPVNIQIAIQDVGIEYFLPKPAETRGRKPTEVDTWHVCVSARPEVDVKAFFNQMSKALKKKVLKGKGRYTLEQREEDPEKPPSGWHIHLYLILENTVSKAKILQAVQQCFSPKYCDANGVWVRPVVSDKHEENVISYLSGVKSVREEDKTGKIAKDRISRQSLEIPDYVEF